jgi:N-methylhydantoinase A
MSPRDEAARAIIDIAVAKMSLAVREVSVAKGYDPRDFALVASGGAGPPHAIAIARELAIPTVIIPRFPSHFSALGMLMADERHDFARTFYAELNDADFALLSQIHREMVEGATRVLTSKEQAFQLYFDLRYVGQEFALSVPVSDRALETSDRAEIRQAFDALHELRYAHHSTEEPVEIINLRLVARGRRAKLEMPPMRREGTAKVREHRMVTFAGGGAVRCPVYDREALPAGAKLEGPALVSEYGSTTVIFPGDRLAVAPTGELIITVENG